MFSAPSSPRIPVEILFKVLSEHVDDIGTLKSLSRVHSFIHHDALGKLFNTQHWDGTQHSQELVTQDERFSRIAYTPYLAAKVQALESTGSDLFLEYKRRPRYADVESFYRSFTSSFFHRLPFYTNLKDLRLADHSITSEVVTILSHIPSLRHLALTQCDIHTDILEPSIPRLSQLESFSFEQIPKVVRLWPYVSPSAVAGRPMLFPMVDLHTLQRFEISSLHCRRILRGLTHIFEASHVLEADFPALKSLAVENYFDNEFTSEAESQAEVLEFRAQLSLFLSRCSNLESFTLHSDICVDITPLGSPSEFLPSLTHVKGSLLSVMTFKDYPLRRIETLALDSVHTDTCIMALIPQLRAFTNTLESLTVDLPAYAVPELLALLQPSKSQPGDLPFPHLRGLHIVMMENERHDLAHWSMYQHNQAAANAANAKTGDESGVCSVCLIRPPMVLDILKSMAREQLLVPSGLSTFQLAVTTPDQQPDSELTAMLSLVRKTLCGVHPSTEMAFEVVPGFSGDESDDDDIDEDGDMDDYFTAESGMESDTEMEE